MNAEWMLDARKIPDEVMNYLRRIAVQAVEEKHYSPEVAADFLNISRSSIYDWLVPVHFPYIMGAGRGAKGRPARRSAMAARR
jgi:transposase